MRQMNRLVLRLAVQALKKKTNSQSPQLVWKPHQDFVTKRCSKWKLVNLKNKWTTATEPAEFNATKVHEAPSHEEDCNDGCNPITVKRWWPFTHGTSTVPALLLPSKKNHCHSCSLKSKDLPCESDLSKFRHFDRSQRAKRLGFKVKGCRLKSGNLSLQAMKQWCENHLRLLDQWNVQTYNLRTPVVFWSSSYKPLMVMCRWNCKSTVWLVATSKQDLSRTADTMIETTVRVAGCPHVLSSFNCLQTKTSGEAQTWAKPLFNSRLLQMTPSVFSKT